MAGRSGNARHKGDPLTVEQIKALPEGASIVVTWSGGNGPWRYTVAQDEHYGPSAVSASGAENALLQWDDQTNPIQRVTLDA